MRQLLNFTLLAFAAMATPAYAAEAAPTERSAPKTEPEVEIEMPEIMIIMPAAKFEQAIVRDNEVPVVLLLV